MEFAFRHIGYNSEEDPGFRDKGQCCDSLEYWDQMRRHDSQEDTDLLLAAMVHREFAES